jgi:hypothetical protein
MKDKLNHSLHVRNYRSYLQENRLSYDAQKGQKRPVFELFKA